MLESIITRTKVIVNIINEEEKQIIRGEKDSIYSFLWRILKINVKKYLHFSAKQYLLK